LGLLRWGPRKKGEPLRQTHLATIHIHVHTLINLSEIKSKANPIKKSMIPVPGEGRVTFSPPLKYAPATLLLIPPPSFLNNYHHTPLILLAPLCLVCSITKTRRKPEPK